MKTIGYIIVNAYSIKELMAKVGERLPNGWEVTGGVSTNVVNGEAEYFQAMVFQSV